MRGFDRKRALADAADAIHEDAPRAVGGTERAHHHVHLFRATKERGAARQVVGDFRREDLRDLWCDGRFRLLAVLEQ